MTRVASGRDMQSRLLGDTASNGTGLYAAANWMAFTQNATAPADSDTGLTAEINVASGGLNRAQATYAHTTGASSYTLTRTATMAAADGASVQLNKLAIFSLTGPPVTAATSMIFETAIPSPPTLVPGDQITATETVSI